MPTSPPVRRRQLGMELKRLRLAVGKDQQSAAEWIGVPETAMSKIEKGKQRASLAHVKLLCQLYGVESPHSDMLERLAKESAQRGWWAEYGKTVPTWFQDYVGMETEAAESWTYEQELVPGLFQAASYTEALTLASNPKMTEDDARKYAEVRSVRQDRLRSTTEPLKVRAVLNEAILHRTIGGEEVMREQITKLIEMAELPTVNLRILPFSAGAHPAVSSFTALRFPDEPMNTIYIELDRAALYLERPSEIERYSNTFETLCALALSETETLKLLRQRKKE